MRNIYTLFILFLAFCFSSHTQAHSRSESYSKWKVIDSNFVELRYTLKLADIGKMEDSFKTQMPDWQNRVMMHIDQLLELSVNGKACDSHTPMTFETQAIYLQLKKSFYCENTQHLIITNNAIFNIDSRHIHIARFSSKEEDIEEFVFLSNSRSWSPNQLEISSSTSRNFSRFFFLGAEHIVSGWDHLAFLAAIILLVLISNASIKTLLMLVTGFTIGHSISLIMTSLGFFIPHGLSVESLIAFSIALLAIEGIAYKNQEYFLFGFLLTLALIIYAFLNLFIFNSALTTRSLLGLIIFVFSYFLLASKSEVKSEDKLQTQIFITVVFGFIHGFGFAGSLQEIGLPQDKLLSGLLGFNLGVEAGQVLILIHVLLLFRLFKLLSTNSKFVTPFSNLRELSIETLCAGLFGLGIFWFIERSII